MSSWGGAWRSRSPSPWGEPPPPREWARAARGLGAAAALLLGLALLLLVAWRGAAAAGAAAGLSLALGALWWAALGPSPPPRPPPWAPPAAAPQAPGRACSCPCGGRQEPGRKKAAFKSPGADALRPSALFTYTPQKWNPSRQIHFARLGGFPVVRRVNLGASQSSLGTWAPRPDRRLGSSSLVAESFSPVPPSWLPPTPASPAWPTPPAMPHSPAPDPCARETVVKALNTLMAGRKRPKPKEEGSLSSLVAQESKRRRQDSSESCRPAFEPVVANGGPASQVPKPGTLKRPGPQLSPNLEDSTGKKSCPCSFSLAGTFSPQPVRNNCIYSSYSSSGGIEQLWKRRGVKTSVSSQDSSCSESLGQPLGKGPPSKRSLLEKAAIPKSGSSAPAKADKAVQVDLAPEAPVKNQGSCTAPHLSPSSGGSSGGGGPRRRKVQLVLIPKEQLVMPPPVELGYKITVADYNADRLERLNQFRRGLDSKKDAPPSTEEAPSSTLRDGSPLGQESQKGVPEGGTSSGQADGLPPPAPAPPPPPPPPAVSLHLEASPMPLGLSAPSSQPGTPGPACFQAGEAAAQPVPPPPPPPPPPLAAPKAVTPLSLGLAQPAGGGSGSATPTSSSSSSSSSEKLVQTPARPSTTAPAKPSLLFRTLTSPLAGQPAPPAAAPVTTSPAPGISSGASTSNFPLIFGTPASNEPSGLRAGGTPGAPALAPGGTLGSPAAGPTGPTYKFKPLFGPLAPPASTAGPEAAGTPSLPAFPTGLQPAAGPGQTSSSPQGSSVPSAGLPTPLASQAGSAGVTTVSASRATFSLGPGVLATTASAAAPSPSLRGPSAPQPSHFGAQPGSGSAAVSPLYPFGTLAKPPGPALSPLASATFGQAPPGTTEGALGPIGFGSGNSQVSPAAPLAVTTQSPFGSSSPTATPAGLVSALKPLLPSGASGRVPEGQPPTLKAAPELVSFGSPLTFTGPEALSTFGGDSSSITAAATQAPFGESGVLASFGAKSAPQAPFGALASFAAAPTTTTSAFPSASQPPGGGGTAGFPFGGSAPPSFPFGASMQLPPPSGGTAFGAGAGQRGGSPTSRMLAVNFQFGSGATGTAPPFGASVGQISLRGAAQSSDAFSHQPSAPEAKAPFGAALPQPPAFGQGTSTPGSTALGGSTPTFGTAGTSAFHSASTPAFTGSGPTFGPTSAPSFSIGSGTRTGGRQRLQARRQHIRKK